MKSKTKYLWKREVTDTITGKVTVENIEVDPFDVVNEDGRSLGDLLEQNRLDIKQCRNDITALQKEFEGFKDIIKAKVKPLVAVFKGVKRK